MKCKICNRDPKKPEIYTDEELEKIRKSNNN